MQNMIVCLMGPTASGKTDLAIELTNHFPCDIISVDSAMVYRGMDIGTAKPSQRVQQNNPHALVDICDPTEAYSAGQFCQDAVKAIQDAHQHGRIPLLVGGTMLYFRALLHGLSPLPPADQTIRSALDKEAIAVGWPALHTKLSQIDALTAQRLHPNDGQRIQRALEVYQLTGIPLGQWHAQQQSYLPKKNVISIGLLPEDRETLKQKIAARFHTMLAQGFMEEMKRLYARKDLNAHHASMRAVGYKQGWQHLSNEIDYQTMILQTITATQQLAKRQLTWLRTWPNLKALNCASPTLIFDLCRLLQQEIEQYQTP